MTFVPATTIVALRLPPLFATTFTVALPELLPPPLTVIHDEFDEDVQVHPDAVVTLTVAFPASGPNERDVGATA